MSDKITVDLELLVEKIESKRKLLQDKIYKKLQLQSSIITSGGSITDSLEEVLKMSQERDDLLEKVYLLRAVTADDDSKSFWQDVLIKYL